MANMDTESVGQPLHNGAVILASSNGIVLCQWDSDYVTWAVDENGDAYWGNYFPLTLAGLNEAMADFVKRAE